MAEKKPEIIIVKNKKDGLRRDLNPCFPNTSWVLPPNDLGSYDREKFREFFFYFLKLQFTFLDNINFRDN